jgi:2-(1,2-epoxy-1,2-dihydrophenyl)acetyl-CoA isomerase
MPLEYVVEEGVGLIRLNRPDVLNAFDEELGLSTLEAVNSASADGSVRCVVITGAGRAFSSGEDLSTLSEDYRAGDVPDLGATLVSRYNPLIRAIRSAPKPVVAALNGVAAGAGASIALACDFRIASERAKITLAFIKVGLIPDSGAIWLLSKMVGSARAWELCATGDAVSAADALSWGLVNKVVPDDHFHDEWRAYARSLASGPTRAYALTKMLANNALERTLIEQLDAEVSAQSEAGQTLDHLEGVQAFLEKRAPNFRGE